jgi:hypothetical protein
MVVKLEAFQQLFVVFAYRFLREVAYELCEQEGQREGCGEYQPTFEVASVRELRVVDLPEDGFPTRPIRGSRGILT